MCAISQPEDKQRASQQFSKLQAAMKVLGISGDEQRAFWLVLGAIYHLGSAGATKGKIAHRLVFCSVAASLIRSVSHNITATLQYSLYSKRWKLKWPKKLDKIILITLM